MMKLTFTSKFHFTVLLFAIRQKVLKVVFATLQYLRHRIDCCDNLAIRALKERRRIGATLKLAKLICPKNTQRMVRRYQQFIDTSAIWMPNKFESINSKTSDAICDSLAIVLDLWCTLFPLPPLSPPCSAILMPIKFNKSVGTTQFATA